MNTQVNFTAELELINRKVVDLTRSIWMLKKTYSCQVEDYIMKSTELTELHKALNYEINRTPLDLIDEHFRRYTIIELRLEIENFEVPPAPDSTFYCTELASYESQLKEYNSRLIRLLAYSASMLLN